jgi:hypothetical protein
LKEPETFEVAYYHPNLEEKMKWREEILKELDEGKRKKFMKRFVSRSCLTGAHASKTSGYLKLNAMEFFLHG